MPGHGDSAIACLDTESRPSAMTYLGKVPRPSAWLDTMTQPSAYLDTVPRPSDITCLGKVTRSNGGMLSRRR